MNTTNSDITRSKEMADTSKSTTETTSNQAKETENQPQKGESVLKTIYNAGGIAIGILSILAAFYISASERKEPGLSVVSILRTSLLAGDVQRPAVEISYGGSRLQDPWLERLRVENIGTEPIERDDIKEALKINFSSVNVINAALPTNYPKSIAPTVVVQGAVIKLSNFFLNPGGYFDLEVLFDGEPSDFQASAIISQMTQNVVVWNSKQLRPHITGIEMPENFRKTVVASAALVSFFMIGMSLVFLVVVILDVTTSREKQLVTMLRTKFAELSYDEFRDKIVTVNFGYPVDPIAWKVRRYALRVKDHLEEHDWWLKIEEAPENLLVALEVSRDYLLSEVKRLKLDADRKIAGTFADYLSSSLPLLWRTEYREVLESVFRGHSHRLVENPAEEWRKLIKEAEEKIRAVAKLQRSSLWSKVGQVLLAIAVVILAAGLVIVVAGPVRSLTGWW